MIVPTKFEFPFKLHTMLNDAENNQSAALSGIVSWLPQGNGFIVYVTKNFTKLVMPHYFGGNIQYRSFQRQLNIYGFKRITERKSPYFGAYCHPLLRRGSPHLCLGMIRVKVKSPYTKQYHLESKVSQHQEEDIVTSRLCDEAFVKPQRRNSLRNHLGVRNRPNEKKTCCSHQTLTVETRQSELINVDAIFELALEPIPFNMFLGKQERSTEDFLFPDVSKMEEQAIFDEGFFR